MLKLQIVESYVSETGVVYQNGFTINIPNGLDPLERHEKAKVALDVWMKEKVDRDVKRFINVYSKKLQLFPKSFRIKDQKHLWVSCGKDNIIKYQLEADSGS
jgi:predicted metal-dependent hydrolase